MDKTISQDHVLNSLFALLDETFKNTHGIYLDKNTSLFQTLETVTSEEASIPVGGKCASLAAQVAHVTFYLEVLERYIFKNDTSRVDWGKIWRMMEKVTPEEWEAYKENLELTYRRLDTALHENETWNEDTIGGAMGIVVHTAYHLGELRQVLCKLKKGELYAPSPPLPNAWIFPRSARSPRANGSLPSPSALPAK